MGLRGQGLELQEFSDCPQPSKNHKIMRKTYLLTHILHHTLPFQSVGVQKFKLLKEDNNVQQKHSKTVSVCKYYKLKQLFSI